MVEKEIQREKEAEAPSVTHYDKSTQRLKEVIEQARHGIKVIKGKNKPWEINRQGIIRRYAGTDDPEIANNNWTIFCHEIRQHSGRHRHQGGINLFVTKGKGYTVVDGKRFDWSEGDLILLSIKNAGVEHQHFNVDGLPSRWICLWHRSATDCTGFFREQNENFMMWKEKGDKK